MDTTQNVPARNTGAGVSGATGGKRPNATGAASRIKAAMKEREKWVLAEIRREGTYRPASVSVPIWNAIARLETKKRIRYSQARSGYVLRVRP